MMVPHTQRETTHGPHHSQGFLHTANCLLPLSVRILTMRPMHQYMGSLMWTGLPVVRQSSRPPHCPLPFTLHDNEQQGQQLDQQSGGSGLWHRQQVRQNCLFFGQINFKGEMVEVTSSNRIGQQLLAELIKYIVPGIKDTQGQYLEGMEQEHEMLLTVRKQQCSPQYEGSLRICRVHTHIFALTFEPESPTLFHNRTLSRWPNSTSP